MSARRRTMACGVVAGLAAVGIVLTGCSGGGGGTGGTAKLEMQTGLGSADPTLTVLQDITKTCTPADTTIDLVPMTNTYEADMKTRMASGDLPDIWSTHGWSLPRYSPFLEPLNKQSWADKFNTALAPAMQNKDGQFFALPITTDVAGILYNKDTLSKAGVDPSTLTTWDAFTKALVTLKDAGVTPLSSSSKDSWMAGNVADFMSSGAFSAADLEKFTKGTFVEGGYTTMLDEVQKWAKAGDFNPDFSSITMDEIGRGLGSGDVGFVFVQNSLVSTALEQSPDAKLGFIPIPSFVGDPYFVGGEGTAYGVWNKSPHKKQALAYIDCLAQPDNISKLAKALGAIPGLTDATADLGVLQDSYDTLVKPNTYTLEPYFDRVYLPNGMWDTMVTTTGGVISGQSTPAAAVDQMKQQFSSLFGQ
ncbi:ABC transporter substrate-binding protein [Microbacterium elymi]|uniref:ABC transporter substrate-binding protein n=1 Tax=Microbacterium elymi TaxID=2909587 RepID=A0ABY5NGJ5_9MICO|nr:ABC transporter substrate-binding protein [Microbacterium elymi]UUT34278.1 ABC transporter substrate-binding protein [Microbacterium elymi]